MRALLAAGALLLVGAGGPAGAPPCSTAGCFTGTAEGVRNGALNGRAAYRVTPAGDLLIVLTAPGETPLALVFSRDSGGVPTRGGDLTIVDGDTPDEATQGSAAGFAGMLANITAGLDSMQAHGVDVSGAKQSLAPAPSAAATPASIHAGISGGTFYSPVWLIPAETGTLHLDPGSGAVLVGRFEVQGEGRTVEDGEPVTITIRGSFRATRQP